MEKVINTPYVITICSGKGGVGKSVLSANLAYEFSKFGNTLVWDADINFPNQHLLFGVEPPVRTNDVYSKKAAIGKATYQLGDNLHILAGMPATGISEEYTPAVFIDVYEELLSDFDFDIIVIDTRAGGTTEAVQCCNIADLVALVITDEPTSLLDAYGLLKMILPYIDMEYINLIVNNVIDNEDADEIFGKLSLATEKFLGFSLDMIGFVPYDRAVRSSIIHQDLLVRRNPGLEVSIAIRDIARRIMESVPLELLD